MACSFSDDIASERGFIVSKTLTSPIGYNGMKNPILECLADQISHDQTWSDEKMSGSILGSKIISALNQDIIQWPQNNQEIISKEKWIWLMKIDQGFYVERSRDDQEMKCQERILLGLAAKYLKRKITLIPFFEEDKDDIFFPTQKDLNHEVSKDSYYLLSCNNAGNQNFFASIFLK